MKCAHTQQWQVGSELMQLAEIYVYQTILRSGSYHETICIEGSPRYLRSVMIGSHFECQNKHASEAEMMTNGVHIPGVLGGCKQPPIKADLHLPTFFFLFFFTCCCCGCFGTLWIMSIYHKWYWRIIHFFLSFYSLLGLVSSPAAAAALTRFVSSLLSFYSQPKVGKNKKISILWKVVIGSPFTSKSIYQSPINENPVSRSLSILTKSL